MSMFTRGYIGTFHAFSEKHMDRYVADFAGRHNVRPRHAIDMMQSNIVGMRGKRLRYRGLIAEIGLSSGVRLVA